MRRIAQRVLLFALPLATAAVLLLADLSQPVAAAGAGATSGSGRTASPMDSTRTPGPFDPNLDPGESVIVRTLPPLIPSHFPQAKHVGFHEFQADCTINRVAHDDPIVFPRQPGVSHMHTFMGGRANAFSTTGKLTSASTSCSVPADHSGYWFPAMYLGNRLIKAQGPQIVYYKAGIRAYNTIRAFPGGLRFVVGSPAATEYQFEHRSGASGWSCGNSYDNWDFPASCPGGSKLIVRYQAPSCWDGRHLDKPDHKSQMAYPVDGRCPSSHPVALPMLEFKIAYPVFGDLSGLRLSSGRGYSWHADFFASWNMTTEEALVTQCINGGGQCDARGYDQHKPGRRQVLNGRYQLTARRL